MLITKKIAIHCSLAIFGLTAFIPIAGCSRFEGVSKDCDELARKYLKARFDKAAQNNGDFTKYLLVLKSSQNVSIDATVFAVLNATFYGVHPDGKIEHANITIKPYGFFSVGQETTTPSIATNSQIVCSYPAVYGSRVEKLPGGWYDHKGFVVMGASVTVSEDNDGIYWRDTQ